MSANTAGLHDLDTLPDADRARISETLGSLLEGFQHRDVARLREVYSASADWVNAFGSVRRGRTEILAYLSGLFEDDNFNAGVLVGAPTSTVRCLTGDIVTVSTHLQIRGQALVDGGVIEVRDNHSLRILQKQADGRWLIVSEMYMDARPEASYVDHS